MANVAPGSVEAPLSVNVGCVFAVLPKLSGNVSVASLPASTVCSSGAPMARSLMPTEPGPTGPGAQEVAGSLDGEPGASGVSPQSTARSAGCASSTTRQP